MKIFKQFLSTKVDKKTSSIHTAMPTAANSSTRNPAVDQFHLSIDTCGSSGSVALGRLADGNIEILGQIELEGRTYSVSLIPAVRELLAAAGLQLADLDGIVAVRGPGSFTGVRIGLSAVKGLAEPAGIPVRAVSRLAVMAAKAGTKAAALDAHRREVFLRLGGAERRELLAGADDLAGITPPEAISICEDASEELLRLAWPTVNLLRVEAPTASDALKFCLQNLDTIEVVNLALLDGHYLRRSDAEIFGDKPGLRSA